MISRVTHISDINLKKTNNSTIQVEAPPRPAPISLSLQIMSYLRNPTKKVAPLPKILKITPMQSI